MGSSAIFADLMLGNSLCTMPLNGSQTQVLIYPPPSERVAIIDLNNVMFLDCRYVSTVWTEGRPEG